MKRSGTRFAGWLWSQTDNHWSNLTESKSLVRHVLAPYFKRKIEELGLPQQQKCVWVIDCWPVHISAAFRDFMKTDFPWILVLFVPPNCTSKLQPQDVFYQKPFKQGIYACFCDHQVALFRLYQQGGAQRLSASSRSCRLQMRMCSCFAHNAFLAFMPFALNAAIHAMSLLAMHCVSGRRRAHSPCCAGDPAALTNFNISALKPLIPAWLYAGFSRIAKDPPMVRRGWEKCGLRSMFDDERRVDIVRAAKRAMHDTSSAL